MKVKQKIIEELLFERNDKRNELEELLSHREQISTKITKYRKRIEKIEKNLTSLGYNFRFKKGDRVVFLEDLFDRKKIKLKVKKGAKGTIICQFKTIDYCSIQVDNRHFPVTNVPNTILEKFETEQEGENNNKQEKSSKIAI